MFSVFVTPLGCWGSVVCEGECVLCVCESSGLVGQCCMVIVCCFAEGTGLGSMTAANLWDFGTQ